MRIILSILYCSMLIVSAQIPPRVMDELMTVSTLSIPSAPSWDMTNYANIKGSWTVDAAIINALGKITNMPDRSASGFTLVNPSVTDYKTNNVLNGHAVARGPGGIYTSSTFTNNGRCEIAMVVRLVTPDSDHLVLSIANATPNPRPYLYWRPSPNNDIVNGVSGVINGTFPKVTTNVWYILQMIWSDNASDGGIITNGVRATTCQTGDSSNPWNGIRLFYAFNFDGLIDFVEAGFFNGTNTASVRTEIYNGLKSKYGL